MLYGAIAGDIAGSTFEYYGMTGAETSIFPPKSAFTDDTILTLAVADALMNNMDIAGALRTYALLYPRPKGGYGSRFVDWLEDGFEAKPYNSFGNGSAMRVSACGWVADTLEGTLAIARRSAECTHNHPEGIKGAEATAACIFLARKGKTKEEIGKYITDNYYDLKSYEEYYSESYSFHKSCQETVPRAIAAFLYSTNFEDTLRFSMLIDKDADTIGAIAGSIAEAFYGVPQEIKDIVRRTLDEPLLSVLDAFEETFNNDNEKLPTLVLKQRQ